MIDLDFLRGLIEAVDNSGIDSLEISRGGTRIRVNKTPPPAPVAAAAPAALPAPVQAHAVPAAPAAPAPSAPAEAAPAPAASNLVEVKSPMVGTFYRSPAPEAPPYVEVGSRITPGMTLCILEAMKLMNELPAEISGIVREICVENGEPVEYGQVLFRVEPT
jgi:acetyl-CoA carboxylase biotin carboxyl carrier protein